MDLSLFLVFVKNGDRRTDKPNTLLKFNIDVIICNIMSPKERFELSQNLSRFSLNDLVCGSLVCVTCVM